MELIKRLRIDNDLGIHARAAAKIVKLVSQYRSNLYLKKDGREVDGGSILAILTLSCPKGTDLELRVVGEDSHQLMEGLTELFAQKFGESE